MKIAVLILAAVASLAAAAPTPVSSRIDGVTVYADRARVTRSAQLDLPAGVAEYAWPGLPGWIDEDSVRASVAGGGGPRIADVRVRRDFLAQSSDEEVRKAEAAVREIEDRIEDLQDAQRVLDLRAKQVEDVKVFSMEKLPKDAATTGATVETYARAVDFVSESAGQIATKRRELARKIRDLQPEREARQRKLSEVQQRSHLEQSTVTVLVESPAAGRATMKLEYMLPGASWEPSHELRSSGPGATKVQLASYAIVSQTTGEDWSGARLTFSTQSPDEVMRVPELGAMRLGLPTAPVPVTKVSGNNSFSLAQQKFAAGNGYWYAANNAGVVGKGTVEVYNDNAIVQQGRSQRAQAIFNEIQTRRGTTAHFAGEGLPTVPSDGRAVRVRIGSVELPAVAQIVAAPELSLNAVHTVSLTNSGTQPLLPGKVSMFREGAFLGTTDLDFVADGETFSVLMGVAEQIKLSRVIDRRNSALVRGQRTRLQVAFDIAVENLSDAPAHVKLGDRIPVSDNKEIRVSSVSIKPDQEPDSKGLLSWDVDLKAKEKQTFRVAYTLEYPAAVLTTRALNAPPQQAMPAAGNEMIQSDGLRARILDLESKM